MPELLRETLRNVRAHAFRYALTSAGIAWGVLMLTYLSSAMIASRDHFTREIEEVGPRLVWVFPGVLGKPRIGERGARRLELENEDAFRLAGLASVEHADPNILLWSQVVRAGQRTKLLEVFGVTENAASMRNFEVAEGRFFTPLDLARGSRVAFLGPEAAARLFGRRSPVGETIQVDSLRLRVIGVAVAKHDQMFNMQGQDDEHVLVPYTTVQRWLRKTEKLEGMVFAPVTKEGSWEAVRHARQLLGLHHHFPPDLEMAVGFLNIQDVLRIVDTLFLGMWVFLTVAALVTVLVGAFGVMNIMLVVVGERTREIGLRKALGATDRSIFVQFLAEAALVAGSAGLVGALLGLGLVQLLASLLPEGDPGSAPPVLDPLTALVTGLALVATAIAAGALPARRAARIPPSESLRAS